MQVSQKERQEEHGVSTTFVCTSDSHEFPKLELLEPLNYPSKDSSSSASMQPRADRPSPISGFLEKNPRGGIHHLCFDVDDLSLVVQELEQQHQMKPLAPMKIGAHGKPVVFYHPKYCHGILIELQQI